MVLRKNLKRIILAVILSIFLFGYTSSFAMSVTVDLRKDIGYKKSEVWYRNTTINTNNNKVNKKNENVTGEDMVTFLANILTLNNIDYILEEIKNQSVVTYSNIRELALFCCLNQASNYEYGPISIVKAILNDNGNEKEVYVVSLAGTGFDEEQATGLVQDLLVSAECENDYLSAIRYAMKKHIPYGSDVILSGLSLGGMVSQQACADPKIKNDYNILYTVAIASPIICPNKTEGKIVLIQDESDIVPLLSLKNDKELYKTGYDNILFNVKDSGSKTFISAHGYGYVSSEVWKNTDILGIDGGNSKLEIDFSTFNSEKAEVKNDSLENAISICLDYLTELPEKGGMNTNEKIIYNFEFFKRFLEKVDFSKISKTINTENYNEFLNIINNEQILREKLGETLEKEEDIEFIIETINEISSTLNDSNIRTIVDLVGKLDLASLQKVLKSIDIKSLLEFIESIGIDIHKILIEISSDDIETFNIKESFGKLQNFNSRKYVKNYSSTKMLRKINLRAAVNVIIKLDINSLIKFLVSINTNDLFKLCGLNFSSTINSTTLAIRDAEALANSSTVKLLLILFK